MTLRPDLCLSVLELLDIKAGHKPSTDAAAHLAECPRCSHLLKSIPGADAIESAATEELPSIELRRPLHKDGPPVTGDLYVAAGDDPGTREVVVVLGRAPQRDDVYVVAPTSTSLAETTDLDLIVEDSPLGYPHLVCVWGQGQVFVDQLLDYRGRLDRERRERLAQIYRRLMGRSDEELDETENSGLPLQSRDDPRRTFQALLTDRLRLLYGPVDRSLEHLDAHEPPCVPSDSLGGFLEEALSGDSWDAPTLAEVARVSPFELARFRRNELDLTDRTDVSSVAGVLVALRVSADDAEPLVRAALALSSGGERT